MPREGLLGVRGRRRADRTQFTTLFPHNPMCARLHIPVRGYSLLTTPPTMDDATLEPRTGCILHGAAGGGANAEWASDVAHSAHQQATPAAAGWGPLHDDVQWATSGAPACMHARPVAWACPPAREGSTSPSIPHGGHRGRLHAALDAASAVDGVQSTVAWLRRSTHARCVLVTFRGGEVWTFAPLMGAGCHDLPQHEGAWGEGPEGRLDVHTYTRFRDAAHVAARGALQGDDQVCRVSPRGCVTSGKPHVGAAAAAQDALVSALFAQLLRLCKGGHCPRHEFSVVFNLDDAPLCREAGSTGRPAPHALDSVCRWVGVAPDTPAACAPPVGCTLPVLGVCTHPTCSDAPWPSPGQWEVATGSALLARGTSGRATTDATGAWVTAQRETAASCGAVASTTEAPPPREHCAVWVGTTQPLPQAAGWTQRLCTAAQSAPPLYTDVVCGGGVVSPRRSPLSALRQMHACVECLRCAAWVWVVEDCGDAGAGFSPLLKTGALCILVADDSAPLSWIQRKLEPTPPAACPTTRDAVASSGCGALLCATPLDVPAALQWVQDHPQAASAVVSNAAAVATAAEDPHALTLGAEGALAAAAAQQGCSGTPSTTFNAWGGLHEWGDASRN